MPSSSSRASSAGSDPAAATARPRASVLGAWIEGWRRVLAAPAITLSVAAITFLTALPLAVVIGKQLDAHLGSSLEADGAAAGWNAIWVKDFETQATGIGKTFTHEILGFGGTLSAVSDLVDREKIDPAIAGAIATYLVVWLFLSGGILDRVARGRPVRMSAFFAACGVFFVRFLRLGAVIGACYWAIFYWLHPWLFVTLYNRWTRDISAESTGMAIRAGLYVIFLGTLLIVSLVADFAKVRMVVEDRYSVVGGLSSAIRFVRRRPLRVIGLYLLNILVALVIARLWLQTAPAATASVWLAFLGAQLYLVARIWAKLAFMASEVVFFQGELAHAQYTAAPELVWPDSPAAEAIDNLSTRSRNGD